jgi:hypothetical protein
VVRRFGFGKRKTLYQRRAKREKYKVSADWATTDSTARQSSTE